MGLISTLSLLPPNAPTSMNQTSVNMYKPVNVDSLCLQETS
jgi:hypothetical protein